MLILCLDQADRLLDVVCTARSCPLKKLGQFIEERQLKITELDEDMIDREYNSFLRRIKPDSREPLQRLGISLQNLKRGNSW